MAPEIASAESIRTACSLLWNEFRTLTHRLARVSQVQEHFYATGRNKNDSKRLANTLVLGTVAGRPAAARIWLYTTLLICQWSLFT
eukprot:6197287-Pleurochrysis_carterae.AAC.1